MTQLLEKVRHPWPILLNAGLRPAGWRGARGSAPPEKIFAPLKKISFVLIHAYIGVHLSQARQIEVNICSMWERKLCKEAV